jgi:hypothetical protein
MNAAGGAFDWLAEEPDLYSDADLVARFLARPGITFGAIVLTDFPFTDLTAAKHRPALVTSTDNDRRTDVVVAYITSVPRNDPDAVPASPPTVWFLRCFAGAMQGRLPNVLCARFDSKGNAPCSGCQRVCRRPGSATMQ